MINLQESYEAQLGVKLGTLDLRKVMLPAGLWSMATQSAVFGILGALIGSFKISTGIQCLNIPGSYYMSYGLSPFSQNS